MEAKNIEKERVIFIEIVNKEELFSHRRVENNKKMNFI
jgi:hypothetical protein